MILNILNVLGYFALGTWGAIFIGYLIDKYKIKLKRKQKLKEFEKQPKYDPVYPILLNIKNTIEEMQENIDKLNETIKNDTTRTRV